MTEPDRAGADGGTPRRLESWKEIAAYLKRDVKTVQRWERHEGLPVHRHQHTSAASVFAFTTELDEWRGRRLPPARPFQRAQPSWRLPTSDLIGREPQLAWLTTRFEQACAGTRQIALVTGEMGIGKTALVRTFLARLPRDVLAGAGDCVEQYGMTEPYLPVLDALTAVAQGPYRRRAVRIVDDVASSWAGELLRRPASPAAANASGESDEGNRRARELVALVETLSADTPTVLVLEDLQWSDPATIDLLARLAGRSAPARLLIVGTFRVQSLLHAHPALWRFRQQLGLRAHCGEMALPLLAPEAVAQYLRSRGEWDDLAQASAWLHARTEGNPLFLEHLLRHLADLGRIDADGGRWSLEAEPTGGVPLPSTLQALLEVEATRLSKEAYAALCAGSVAGMRFSAAQVSAVLRCGVADVESALAALVGFGCFLRAAGANEGPDGLSAAYEFDHALSREVLYNRVPAGTRARYHRLLGEHIERGYGERTNSVAAELASHFDRGGEPAKAIAYYEAVADHGLTRGGDVEVQVALGNALRLSGALPAGAERDSIEVRLRSKLCVTLTNADSGANPAVRYAYEQLHDAATRTGADWEIVHALVGIARVQVLTGDLHEAAHTCERARHLARAANRGVVSALTAEAARTLPRGDFLGTVALAEEALNTPADAWESVAILGFDSATGALNTVAWSTFLLGDYAAMHNAIVRMRARAGC